VTVGTLQLATFVNPAGLQSLGENLYAETAASGTPSSNAPGSNGAGTLNQGYVETSNVNVVEEDGQHDPDPACLRNQQQGDHDIRPDAAAPDPTLRLAMKMSRIVGWAGVLLGLAGCGTTPSSIIQQPTTARPQALPAQSAGNGAIYQPASYTPMFEDRRARHVGDVLTIVINEKTQAGKKASSNGSKTGAVDSSIGAVVGLPFKTFQGSGVKADSSASYDDKSAIDSSNLFSGYISVTVTEVLPNGNLVVAGEKQIALDKST